MESGRAKRRFGSRLLLRRRGRRRAAPSVAVGLAISAPLSSSRLDHAYREVARILGRGVQVEWQLAPSTTRPLLRVVLERRPARKLVAGCSRGRHDHRLALAGLGSLRVTVWTEQVARAVRGDWDAAEADPESLDPVRYGRALGRTLAHELAHLLLRRGHARRGLLQARFRRSDLIARDGRAFRLSDRDLAELRRAAVLLARIEDGDAC